MRALKPPVPENSIAGKLLLEWITLSKVASLIENEEIFSVLIINYLFVKLKTVAKVLKSNKIMALMYIYFLTLRVFCGQIRLLSIKMH